MKNWRISKWLQRFISTQYPQRYCSDKETDRYVYYSADRLYRMAKTIEDDTTSHWLSLFMKDQYDCFRQEWYGIIPPKAVVESFAGLLNPEDYYSPNGVFSVTARMMPQTEPAKPLAIVPKSLRPKLTTDDK